MSKKNKEIGLFDEQSYMEIEFPLCLKNIRKDSSGFLYKEEYWRYMEDGRYELISFNNSTGRNCSHVYGNLTNKDYLNVNYDKGYLIRQCQLFEASSEDEFINKMKEYFERLESFLNPNKIESTIKEDERREEDYPF